ncbi:unnamed protein product, partial [Cladocopium goreaui]
DQSSAVLPQIRGKDLLAKRYSSSDTMSEPWTSSDHPMAMLLLDLLDDGMEVFFDRFIRVLLSFVISQQQRHERPKGVTGAACFETACSFSASRSSIAQSGTTCCGSMAVSSRTVLQSRFMPNAFALSLLNPRSIINDADSMAMARGLDLQAWPAYLSTRGSNGCCGKAGIADAGIAIKFQPVRHQHRGRSAIPLHKMKQ